MAADFPAATADELTAAARRATAEPRKPEARPVPSRPWRPLRLRWTAAVAAGILLSTGLGFGIGQWLTPSSSARPATSGLGFLPAGGWSVMQSGRGTGAESTLAAAANVPFRPVDRPGGEPLATLRTLPPRGIVIVATLTTRGHPTLDLAFPPGSTPRLADALSLPATPRWPYRYGLRTAVGGYNVDLKVTFGREPTRDMFHEADEQIARLVVAPADITIAVRPLINPTTAYGSVSSGEAGEKLTVQFKQCGLYPISFRDIRETTTADGGGWSVDVGAPTNGVFRAVSGSAVSDEVAVKSRADIRLAPHGGKRYEVDVVATLSFWKKRVLLQRFDRTRRTWKTFRKLVLTKQFGPGLIWSTTERFVVDLPKRTSIRAVLPLDQAKPCFVAGYSNALKA